MYVNEEEASERSRESMESARTETRNRRTACAWTGSERAFEGERDRIHAGVVTQGMEGDEKVFIVVSTLCLCLSCCLLLV